MKQSRLPRTMLLPSGLTNEVLECMRTQYNEQFDVVDGKLDFEEVPFLSEFRTFVDVDADVCVP